MTETKYKKLKEASSAYRMLRHLYYMGICYKSDLLRTCTPFVSQNGVSLGYRKLREMGLIHEYTRKEYEKAISELPSEVSRPSKLRFCAMTAITRRGRLYLCDNYEGYEPYLDMFSKKLIQPEDMIRSCDQNRAASMFASVPVPVYPCEKPSLLNLYAYSMPKSNRIRQRYEKTQPECELVYPYADEQKVRQMLKAGLFYSVKEMREFFNQISPNWSDKILGTRAKGMFISDTDLYVVYQTGGLMKLYGAMEDILYSQLLHLFAGTDIFRSIESHGTKKNGVSCLVLAENRKAVYEMATGFRNGRVRGSAVEAIAGYRNHQKQPKQIRQISATRKTLSYNYLNYQRIFAVTCDLAGANSLNYLCTHSFEEWIQESVNLFSHTDGFKLIRDQSEVSVALELSGRNGSRNSRALFLPVFEIRLLHAIANDRFNYAVALPEEMCEITAHCLRKAVNYYAVTYDEHYVPAINPMSEEVPLFERSGFPVGDDRHSRYIGSETLELTGCMITDQVASMIKSSVMSIYGMQDCVVDREEGTVFYTARFPKYNSRHIQKTVRAYITQAFTADGQLFAQIETCSKLVPTLNGVDSPVTKAVRERIGFTVSPEDKKILRRAASANGMSLSRYVREVICRHAKTDVYIRQEMITARKGEYHNQIDSR